MKRFDIGSLAEPLRAGAREFAGMYGCEIVEDGIRIETEARENGLAVRFSADGKSVRIAHNRRCDFYRGLRIAMVRGEDTEEDAAFDHLCLMADNSRNAVLNLPSAKRLIRLLAAMGYDRLQLYTEDTYEIAGEPRFGYLRGRFTEEELRELDDCGERFGIEIMPCIQTLAHLGTVLQWPEYGGIRDCGDILLAEEEGTYVLIEKMFAAMSRALRSRNINIGMDEAHMLGLGAYLDRHGCTDRTGIMERHLRRVLDIAAKYGYRCSMWSDMFFRLAFRGAYYEPKGKLSPEVLDRVPKDVTLIYWDYYSRDRKTYDRILGQHRQFSNPIAFAGGAWKWIGYNPANRFSLSVSKIALDACIAAGVRDVTATAWGDNGGDASVFSVLPTLTYYAERCFGHPGKCEEAFREVTGEAWRDFLALELMDEILPAKRKFPLGNASKPLLFNDVLLGQFDSALSPAYQNNLKKAVARLRRAEKKSGFAAMFAAARALAEAVREKFDLGLEIHAAYRAGDREALRALCGRLGRAVRKVRAFHEKYRLQWMAENKPFGFEVQDLRLGGLAGRMETCRSRILDYCEGRCERIPELEEEILPTAEGLSPDGSLTYNCWGRTVTAGYLN